jgi:hypothetical protein
MGTIALIIFIFFMPYAWFLWSSMSPKTGKQRWKKPLVVLIALILISAGLNYYFSHTYQLSFFQNGFESIVALIIAAVILLIISFVNIVISMAAKGAPKSFHNPKVVWIFTGGLCATILFFTMWVYPLAEKASYINKIENALAQSEQQQAGEEITVVFMSSEKECFRTRTSNCTNETYKNAFFLKNNLDTQKEVQVRIRALDSQQKEVKVIESDIMTLEAGELKLVETEESSDLESIWSRTSFETDSRVRSYESLYRYRDAD